jgi:predicted dehydrogenase
MENKKVRLAVLGNGPRGTGLAGVYATHPNVEVVAVCDIADDLYFGRTSRRVFCSRLY